MSGREVEPLSAFFPSIDRNLMRDLDRHLRTGEAEAHRMDPGASSHPPALAAPQTDMSATSDRPNASDILEAVEEAAASMTAMTARIQELERTQYELDAMNTQLRNKLGEIVMAQQHAETQARAEADRADRAEGLAAQHLSRAQELEGDLEAALGDLRRIAEAISGSLMAPR